MLLKACLEGLPPLIFRAEPEARKGETSSPLSRAEIIASHLLATSSTLGQYPPCNLEKTNYNKIKGSVSNQGSQSRYHEIKSSENLRDPCKTLQRSQSWAPIGTQQRWGHD